MNTRTKSSDMEAAREEVFRAILDCALKDERCPGRDVLNPNHVAGLVAQGRIRVEVSTGNWRVATILNGEHAGKKTRANPIKNAHVYLICDASGSVRNNQSFIGGRRPSKPTFEAFEKAMAKL